MHSLMCVETVTVASLKASPCLEFHTPEKQGESPEVNTQPQALFDTPTQVLVGAKHILATINMKEFPLFSSLQIRFSTDFYLRALQREFDKLGDVIELVDLVNVVVANNKCMQESQCHNMAAGNLRWHQWQEQSGFLKP